MHPYDVPDPRLSLKSTSAEAPAPRETADTPGTRDCSEDVSPDDNFLGKKWLLW